MSVNTGSREEVRQFYRAVYFASDDVPMSWTGSYASGTPGDTSSAFKEATRLRINFFRALVGVPADITFNPDYSTKAQRAALMVSANNELNHFPPPSWTFYSAEGAEAAGKSNLAIGVAGPDAIDGYIMDSGANNALVGHRRWLFYPQTLRMGTGDVPGDATRRPANAVWVHDATPGGEFGAPRPPTRTTEVAYPPPGFVPYTLVWPRWSFSYPGADFSGATVSMTRNGQPVAAVPETPGTGTGEPTFVWIYDGKDSNSSTPHARPAADTTYLVNVNNVRIGAATRSFSYSVTVFDPDAPGADTASLIVSGPAAPPVGVASTFAVNKPAFASGFDWRTLQLTPTNKTYTGENGLDGLLATTTPGYDVVQTLLSAAGGSAYRLAHRQPRSDQVLRIPGLFFLSATSAITFQSRLAIATQSETARVQLSFDDGGSWSDVFTQVGTSATDTGFPAPTETAFIARNISLGAYAGRTVAVRLVYSIDLSGVAFVPEPNNAVGWFIDSLALANVQGVAASSPARIAAGTTFSVTPTVTGPLVLQARGVIAGAFPLEWGPATIATASIGDTPARGGHLANLSVRTTAGSGDNTLIVGFAVSGGTKPLLVRGIGPALGVFNVEGAIADPKLELFNAAPAKLTENDNWLAADAATFRLVGAFELANNSRDAALVASLDPGAYTAQVSGNGGTTGIALVELYDTAGVAAGARLVNVSARSHVGTGDNILVAGFNIAGTGARTLLIRAVGPTLTAFGVGGVLADPKLELFEPGGATPLASNDNWDATSEPTFARVGAFGLVRNSSDAVLVVTLPPGNYTAQVSGVNSSTGIALVEVYELP